MKNTLKLVTKDVQKDINDIKTAAEILKNGGIVAVPTETVYGLAADAFNENAVKNIFIAKGRPQDNPLIVHIASFDDLYKLASDVPKEAKLLAEKFWPGPLTIILPKKDSVPDATSGGLSTVAVRMPSDEAARKIIELSCPLAAPSANISGFPSPTAFEHVEADMFGRADAICDGGDCDVGVESTVITLCTKPATLLRPGAVTLSQLREILGDVAVSQAVLKPLEDGKTAQSPGMKYKHYSPKAQLCVVRGNAREFADYANASPYDAVLCFEGEEKSFNDKITVTFGTEDDPLSQARRFFDALRELDEKGAKKALVRNPSDKGVGLAVCNRLYRAAGFTFVNAFKRCIAGLTGPTGAGKGYVGKYLSGLGCYIADTDKIARELTEKGSAFLGVLAESFGNDIINENGELDRALLAQRAFSNKENQLLLNSLMHPEIVRIAYDRCIHALSDGAPAAVIDAPLLFEAGADKLCDTVISVTAPYALRKKRITERDSISEEKAESRMSVQHEDSFYNDKAEFVVRSYEPYDIKSELEAFCKKYL